MTFALKDFYTLDPDRITGSVTESNPDEVSRVYRMLMHPGVTFVYRASINAVKVSPQQFTGAVVTQSRMQTLVNRDRLFAVIPFLADREDAMIQDRLDDYHRALYRPSVPDWFDIAAQRWGDDYELAPVSRAAEAAYRINRMMGCRSNGEWSRVEGDVLDLLRSYSVISDLMDAVQVISPDLDGALSEFDRWLGVASAQERDAVRFDGGSVSPPFCRRPA